MKLQTTVNELVLSNVATTGEFRIRNSAKAFSILSSGLYSNKIKAIIRELSCNAIDSHSAAGKEDVPFEVHLPCDLEPWFSIKDFGLGLDYEGVTQIYTTYFESTKTESNQFIGALGLGSKSPFSYTDNFSITAIKDGKQRIFSAFINEAGIPSVAEMGSCETTDCNGVEVKFSVTESYDYGKFRDEARNVYMWFKQRPIVTGASFTFYDLSYTDRDIIPGVHLMSNRYDCMAVMGNIAYPLKTMPNQKLLGDLSSLLSCNLEIHFEIGELDFAASREELSYIPSTVESITKKLQAISLQLVKHVEEKVNAIDNKWMRAFELRKLSREALFKSSVSDYIKKHKFKLLGDGGYYSNYYTYKLSAEAVWSDYNITLTNFSSSYGRVSNGRSAIQYDRHVGTQSVGKLHIEVQENIIFVLDDMKRGASGRLKANYRKHPFSGRIVLLHCDLPDIAAREKKYAEFLETIDNPPAVVKASSFEKTQVDKKSGDSPAYLKSQISINQYSGTNTISLNWVDTHTLPKASGKYFYVPMNTFTPLKKVGDEYETFKLNSFLEAICNSYLKSPKTIEFYGVRKRKLKEIEALPNWELLSDFYIKEINKLDEAQLTAYAVSETFDNSVAAVYTRQKVANQVKKGSKYLEIMQLRSAARKLDSNISRATLDLCTKYHTGIDVALIRNKVKLQLVELQGIYPMLGLLGYISDTDTNNNEVANYINLVDNVQE